MSDAMKVGDGNVVSMHYTLHVDGKVVDSSQGGEPLKFIQGMGHIIPGLEHELYDMQVGQHKRVAVAPTDGYGEVDKDAFTDVPRDSFPSDVPLKIGTELELKDRSGQPAHARVDAVTPDNIRLDMNHPLAGKQLEFEVAIADVRVATEEEVAHGHVHIGGPEAEHG
jgi:FKBP-type peptidyl-prolyl cis-trans isomerase SlyD